MAMVEPHMTGAERFETTQPYSLLNRKERSRELAQKRRTTYKMLMKDLADELPFSKDVVSQIDYNSRLRLALCFFQMKTLLNKKDGNQASEEDSSCKELSLTKTSPSHAGMLQELMVESLDGFLMVVTGEGTIIYISENIHKHLGLFQSEHIGFSAFDLIHEEDLPEVKKTLAQAEAETLSKVTRKGSSTECSFFCRMKCSRFKVSNTSAKSPGYKLVFVSGHFKFSSSGQVLVAMVRPVSPPSILEIRMEGNMFVTHYTLDFKCNFFDGRLRHLMGFTKEDMIGCTPFQFHHHDDVEATLECSRGLMARGEGLSGYYRWLNKFGEYIWVQSRATMMFDSRTGKPSYVVCMSYIISKEKGEKDLALRRAIAAGENPSNVPESTRSHDPFPVPRPDGSFADPLIETADVRKPVMEIAEKDDPVSTTFSESPLTKGLSISESSSRSVSPESVDSHRTSSPEETGHISSTSSRGDGGYFSHSGSLKGSLISPPSLSHSPFSINSEFSPQSDQVFYSEVEAERQPVSLPSMSSSLIKMEGYATVTQTCEPQTLASLLNAHPSPPKRTSPTPVESQQHFARPRVPNMATSFMRAPYNPDYQYGYRNSRPRAQPCVKQEVPDFSQIQTNLPPFQLPQHYASNPASSVAPELNMVFSGTSMSPHHPVQPLPMLSPEDLQCMDRTSSFNPTAAPGGFYRPQVPMSYRFSH